MTLASARASPALPNNHKSFDLPFDFVKFADCPHYYRSAEAGESERDFSARMAANLDALIEREGPDTIAAMIAEPVMGAGGVIVPPEGYFDAITRVLDQHDIPLIDDEVITGFGRTGEWFGCATYGFEPDSMSIAKALSSAYLPISAIILSPELTDIVEQESGKIGTFGHGFTYTGHPVAAAVALKTIEIYQRRDIVGHVRQVSPHFLKRLRAFNDHPLVGEANGVGLIGGVELVADKKTKQSFDPAKQVGATINNFALEEGLIVRARCSATASPSARRWSSTKPRSMNSSPASTAPLPKASTGRQGRSCWHSPNLSWPANAGHPAGFCTIFSGRFR